MKQRVPAAPQPVFGDATALSSDSFVVRSRAGNSKRSTGAAAGSLPALAPIDQEFLGRTAFITFCLAIVFSLCIALRSLPIASSFAVGAVLSVGLLKSQQWFLRRIIAMRGKNADAYRGWDANIPLWVLVPLKYAGVAALLYFGLKAGLLIPAAFVTGFTLLQIVIFARVAGRLLKATLRPIDQVYISNAKNR